MLAIFLTVLIDMLSFGIVIPDIQLRAASLGASGWLLGMVLASFSLAQFIVSPFAGRLSDYIGRKPILMGGAFLNMLGFIAYAFASTLPLLFLARIVGGIGSSNMASAYAYVADNTAPENRAKSMGILGAAFGIGFVFGPVLGGLLFHLGGLKTLGFASAGIALINVLWIYFFLTEKKPEHSQESSKTGFNFKALGSALLVPGLLALLIMFFAYNLGFAKLESTFVLFGNRRFGFEQLDVGLFLGFVGIQIAIYQGLLVGPLTKRFGERNLARFGLLLVAPGLSIIPFVPSVMWLYLGSLLLCFGAAITGPTTQSLISRSAPPNIQGGIFGITSALGSWARILGPLIGQSAFHYWIALPYLIGGGLTLFAAIIAWTFIVQPASPHQTDQQDP